MLLIKHLSEIKYSAIYITLALFIINVIIWINIDLIILVFSPNIQTFMLYSNLIDAVVQKLSLSFYLSLYFLSPFIIFSILTYFRPGLFKLEDLYKYPPYYWITKTLISQIFFYYLLLYFYNWYLFDWVYTSNWSIDRFIPTLAQIILLIKNLIIISLLINYLIYLSKSIPLIFYFKKFRFYINFFLILFFTLFLPPDLNILLLITIIIFFVLELLFIIILIIKHIKSLI